MFQIDLKRIKYFDYMLFIPVIIISLIGLVTISTTSEGNAFALKQFIWNSAGFILALVVYKIDTRHIKRSAWFFYIFSLILLVMVFVNGVLSHGAKRWISIYFIHIQPSEFMKIAVIIVLSTYFDENPKGEPYGFFDLLLPFLVVVLPIALVIKQPDLGTAIVIAVIAMSIILTAGIKRSLFVKLILIFMVFLPFAWSNLKTYQKDRIMGFLDPYKAPTTYGYNTIQSEIAIGSGGLLGKGFHHATQTQLSFLPESHTDFIFSVFAEQWGFIGCVILLFLYSIVLFRAISIAYRAESDFDRMVSIGIIAYFWISIVFNIGMAMGLLPVVGIPLVFFSYGGSSTITSFFALGILLSIRFKNRA